MHTKMGKNGEIFGAYSYWKGGETKLKIVHKGKIFDVDTLDYGMWIQNGVTLRGHLEEGDEITSLKTSHTDTKGGIWGLYFIGDVLHVPMIVKNGRDGSIKMGEITFSD